MLDRIQVYCNGVNYIYTYSLYCIYIFILPACRTLIHVHVHTTVSTTICIINKQINNKITVKCNRSGKLHKNKDIAITIATLKYKRIVTNKFF